MTVLEMGQTLCLFIYDIVGVSAPTNQGARGEYVFCAPARFVSASGPLLFSTRKRTSNTLKLLDFLNFT